MTVLSGGSLLVNPPVRFPMPFIDRKIDEKLIFFIQKTPLQEIMLMKGSLLVHPPATFPMSDG